CPVSLRWYFCPAFVVTTTPIMPHRSRLALESVERSQYRCCRLSLPYSADPCCGWPILYYCEVARDCWRPDIEWIRFAGFTICCRMSFEKTIVELGMIRHQRCSTEVGCGLRHFLR